MQKDNRFTVRIANDLAELEVVSQSVTTFSQAHELPSNVPHAFSLALEELVANIINYGYDDDKKHEISLHFSIDADWVTVQIQDDGRAFNPLENPEADTKSSLDERQIGGLGIHLVKTMMDDVTYIYQNQKNCLTIRKKIGPIEQ